MIEWILQLENQNMLQVHYSSGYDRYVFPDDRGNYETHMTKPQRNFMENSIKAEMPNADGWFRTFYYWLNKDNPDKAIMSCVRVKRRLYLKKGEEDHEERIRCNK